MEPLYNVTVELRESQALALAQFLKRVGFGEVRINAVDDDEAYRIMDSLNRAREALAEVGFNPR